MHYDAIGCPLRADKELVRKLARRS